QCGLKGHIIVHPQRPDNLASVLPLAVDDIITPICVIFVGSSPPSREWLEKKATPLVVHREYVLNALVWLKHNNPLYNNVIIDNDHLQQLPVNGLLPHEIHVVDSQQSGSSATVSRYDNQTVADAEINEASMRDVSRQEVPFHKVVITDVEGKAPANELRAAAIRHIKHKGGGYVEIPHGPTPVNEFCNPELFPMIYPSLFPYGIGGFEDGKRKYPVSMKRHVRH
ncbi:hypothetical protein C8Q79DRAFT_883770, partial [Trametes meyenii]